MLIKPLRDIPEMSTPDNTVNMLPSSIVPVDLKGQPISDESKASYLAGALAEAAEFYALTGHFASLIDAGVVTLSNGKTAVDSEDAVYLYSKQVPDGETYSFMKPCGTTASRVKSYDDDATALGTPKFKDTVSKLTRPALMSS